jgi:hypothetical protein
MSQLWLGDTTLLWSIHSHATHSSLYKPWHSVQHADSLLTFDCAATTPPAYTDTPGRILSDCGHVVSVVPAVCKRGVYVVKGWERVKNRAAYGHAHCRYCYPTHAPAPACTSICANMHALPLLLPHARTRTRMHINLCLYDHTHHYPKG